MIDNEWICDVYYRLRRQEEEHPCDSNGCQRKAVERRRGAWTCHQCELDQRRERQEAKALTEGIKVECYDCGTKSPRYYNWRHEGQALQCNPCYKEKWKAKLKDNMAADAEDPNHNRSD